APGCAAVRAESGKEAVSFQVGCNEEPVWVRRIDGDCRLGLVHTHAADIHVWPDHLRARIRHKADECAGTDEGTKCRYNEVHRPRPMRAGPQPAGRWNN